MTLEIVVEYMGFDQDKRAWQYFNRYWREWFPCLPSRSSYVRLCANLWVEKQQLQAALYWEMGAIRSSVHHLATAKKIPASEVGDAWYFKKREIDAWITEQSSQGKNERDADN